MRTFESGATRDNDDGKLKYEGFLSPLVLERYAQYMHTHRIQADGTLRAPDNWTKGIPIVTYQDSLVRHVIDAWLIWRTTGKADEDLLCAIMFNAMGYLFETLKEKHGKTNGPVGTRGGSLSGMQKSPSVDQSEQTVLDVSREGNVSNYGDEALDGCNCVDCRENRAARRIRS